MSPWNQVQCPHYALLCKLFLKLFTQPPSIIAYIQFSLICIISIIGPEAYCNLILKNNQYFDKLVTIPITGITNEHLDSNIPVANPSDPHKQMTLSDKFLTKREGEKQWQCRWGQHKATGVEL